MKFFPTKRDFFGYFERMGEVIAKVGQEFRILCDLFPEDLEKKANTLRDLEHEADAITHEIIDGLNKTFVTPIDREDIHTLANRLDDVVDLIENATSNFICYQVEKDRDISPEALKKFGTLIEEMSKALEQIFRDFRNFKNQPRKILEHIIAINKLENQGDELFKEAISELFLKHSNHPVEIIRWKDIFETLENSLDKAEDVANVLEAIAVKHA